MCGIAGTLHFERAQPVDPGRLKAMTSSLSRIAGPTRRASISAEGIGLGHRRLSIIDLATGDQPLANEDGTVWVVFNGEIYNFAELRVGARTRGPPLPHAHRHRSHRPRLRRMGRRLPSTGSAACSRSRSGTSSGGGCCSPAIASASSRSTTARTADGRHVRLRDQGAPRRSRSCPRDWSAEALDAYLTLQYVPCPAHDLPRRSGSCRPGTCSSPSTAASSIRRYWDLTFTGRRRASREDEYLERLDALVTESVRLRLLSDVPLGAFLSGGIDSSLVVAAMAEASPSRVVTTSVGFDENGVQRARIRARRGARIWAPSRTRRSSPPDIARAAAEAGLALRRAVRRLVGGADLLRLGGGARARDRGAVGRRRRRAVGRLRAPPRRAVGTRRRAAGSGRPEADCRHGWPARCRSASRARDRCATWRSRRPTPAPASTPTASSRSDARQRAVFRRLRRARSRDADPFASFRQAYDAVPVAAIRSIGRCMSTSRPTWSTTS